MIKNSLKEGISLHKSITHSEFAPGNILHVGNKVYGVDYGLKKISCVLDDVTYFIISTIVINKYPKNIFFKRSSINSINVKSFFEGYEKKIKIDDNIFESNIIKLFYIKI